MSKLTEPQLAEIAARLGTRSGPTPSTMHQEPTFSASEVRLLLNHIAAVTAERDEANLRRAETVAMCDMLTAERAAANQRAADAKKELAEIKGNAGWFLAWQKKNEHPQDAAPRQE